MGHFCAALPGARGTLSCPHLSWSRYSPLRLGPPSSSCPFTPFWSFTVLLDTAKHRAPEDRYALPHSSHSPGPSTWPTQVLAKCPPKEAQLLTDTASRCPVKVYRCRQLWASQIRMSLLRSPEACGDEDNGHGHPLCAQTSPPPPGPALPYKVLAVRGDGHAEDVAAVAGGLPLGTLLGSWDHVKLPSTLHAP